MAKAKKKTALPAGTTNHSVDRKAVKFVELAEKRVTRAINGIRSVAKLANRNNYHFTDEQVTRISETLRDEVVSMNESFSATPAASKEGFKL